MPTSETAPDPVVSAPVAALQAAVAGVASQNIATGLGSTLGADVAAVAAAVAGLQIVLGRQMAAWGRGDPLADPIGAATGAGLELTVARKLRRAALFVAAHPALEHQWRSGGVTAAQVGIVATWTRRLSAEKASFVIETLAPLLPGLTQADTRTTVEAAVQIADPTEPRQRERRDYDRRYLAWTGTGGGLEFKGYLPAVEAEAFTAAINALAEAARVEGDSVTVGQRAADALVELVVRASAHGLPKGGGLPAAVTLTVSATEAQRITATDPASPGTGRRADAATTASGLPVGDGAVRFGLCCAAITPAHHHQPPSDGSLLARIAKAPIDPLQMGRSVRLATAAQRRALQLRDGGCTIPGCGTEAPYTQPHHVLPWSLGGATDTANLASLCWTHHRQVELGIWVLEPAPMGGGRPWRARRG